MSKQEYAHKHPYLFVKRALLGLLQEQIVLKYPIIRAKFNDEQFNSHIQSQPINKLRPKPKDLTYSVAIGIKTLVDNMDEDGLARDQDFVLMVKHIMHEARHLYQNFVIYQNPMTKHGLDMARMDMLSGYFGGYRRNNYWYLPSELDAEIHGIKDTLTYFSTFLDEHGNPVIDASACLFAAYQEMAGNRVWHYGSRPESLSDILTKLVDMQSIYLTADRGFPFLSDYPQDVRTLDTLLKHNIWDDVIHADDRRGVAFDEKLCAVQMETTKLFMQTRSGMSGEAERIREKYPSRMPGPGERMKQSLGSALERLQRDEEAPQP